VKRLFNLQPVPELRMHEASSLFTGIILKMKAISQKVVIFIPAAV
jgi:hypothetical protein